MRIMWGWQGPLSPSFLYRLHVQLLPPFPTLLSTADGEQQALYKATFPGGAERRDLSSVQAVGHQEAGSQASDCSSDVCHAQYSSNGTYNSLPAAFPSNPPAWLLSCPHINTKPPETQRHVWKEFAYLLMWQCSMLQPLHHFARLENLWPSARRVSRRCFIRATNAPAQPSGALAVQPSHSQKRHSTQ